MEVPLSWTGEESTPPWWPQVSTRWWPPTPRGVCDGFGGGGSMDIPEDLELNGSAVAQGDSAAYYYSTRWAATTPGPTQGRKNSKSSSFAISLMWTEPGLHEVCVTETNQDGCTGPCLHGGVRGGRRLECRRSFGIGHLIVLPVWRATW